jgi:hypothetical protein
MNLNEVFFYDRGKKKGQKNLQSTIKLFTCHKAQCNATKHNAIQQ